MCSLPIVTLLELVRVDITTIAADAIVNAANASLLGGGGVDGAIHRAGGSEILDACRVLRATTGRCDTGDAVVTTAGKLPARHVIHTVGPVWSAHESEDAVALLASCYTRSLDLAVEHDCRTVAFPNVSTGVYHFPKPLAADTALSAVGSWVTDQPDALDRITFVVLDDENHDLYEQRLGAAGGAED